MNKYEWKLKSLAKGIDPDLAIKEIERIENVFGGLTPENILSASKEEDALFHCLFQWDDEVAAENYRLQQARSIINNIEVKVISDGEPRNIPVYEIVNIGEGRVYKAVTDMSSNEIEFVRSSVKREISYLKNKLSNYNEFAKSVKHLDDALKEL